MNNDKKADLVGPGIGNYDDLKKELPDGYEALLPPKERMKAVFAVKSYIEENLCKELNLQMVQVPFSIGGGIGQSRIFMYLHRAVHLGEVTVSAWPKILNKIYALKKTYIYWTSHIIGIPVNISNSYGINFLSCRN